jgi:hypothetical protein
MSDRGIDKAVEKILADHEFAKKVLSDPERTLTSQFDLEPGEWRSIHWALKQDVEDSVGEVSGYAGLNLSNVNLTYTKQIPTLKGQFDRGSYTPTSHANLPGRRPGG